METVAKNPGFSFNINLKSILLLLVLTIAAFTLPTFFTAKKVVDTVMLEAFTLTDGTVIPKVELKAPTPQDLKILMGVLAGASSAALNQAILNMDEASEGMSDEELNELAKKVADMIAKSAREMAVAVLSGAILTGCKSGKIHCNNMHTHLLQLWFTCTPEERLTIFPIVVGIVEDHCCPGMKGLIDRLIKITPPNPRFN